MPRAVRLRRYAYQRKYNYYHDEEDGRFASSPSALDMTPNSDKRFPSQGQLQTASLQQFGRGDSLNATYKTTIAGKNYLVKKNSDEADAMGISNQEERAVFSSKTADVLGVSDFTLPVQKMARNGQDVTVQPWVEGTPMLALSKEQRVAAVSKLSIENYAKLRLYEYVVHDRDRHLGNYLVDSTQKGEKGLKLIDMGLALRTDEITNDFESKIATNYTTPPFKDATGTRSTDPNEKPFNKKVLRSFVEHADEIVRMARYTGANDRTIKALELRLHAIALLSKSKKDPTMNALNAVIATIPWESRDAKKRKPASFFTD